MTPHTQHASYTACAVANLSRVTDAANISKNSKHLVHLMQPNNGVLCTDLKKDFPLNYTVLFWLWRVGGVLLMTGSWPVACA